ncbi:hypothetical protein [Oceanisphaera sp.]|uniref:hypothetical protein n=1 Tax=Oceanisphaera sp. TaxID=1929979 RepID=UPI003A91BCAD
MPQHATPPLLVLSALLLSGCTQLASLPYPTRTPSFSPGTPGVAISQTLSPRLESIAFFSDTPFSADHAEPCINALIPSPPDDTDADSHDNAIVYFGRDVLNTPGLIRVNKRQLGLLPSEYRIAFQLAAFGQAQGTHYGFSRLRLARSDAFDLTNHDFQPMAPTAPDAQLVYLSLRALYQQLDACMADGNPHS